MNFTNDYFQSLMKKEFFPISNYCRIPLQEMQPSIFMTDFSWAHLTDLNLTDFYFRISNSTFLSNLRHDLPSLQATIQIFESSSYTTMFSLESYRRRNLILRDVFLNQLHLEELDQYQLTAGKLDKRDRIHYSGVPRFMSVVISLNLICKPHQND
jgi:hypothetical protein